MKKKTIIVIIVLLILLIASYFIPVRIIEYREELSPKYITLYIPKYKLYYNIYGIKLYTKVVD